MSIGWSIGRTFNIGDAHLLHCYVGIKSPKIEIAGVAKEH